MFRKVMFASVACLFLMASSSEAGWRRHGGRGCNSHANCSSCNATVYAPPVETVIVPTVSPPVNQVQVFAEPSGCVNGKCSVEGNTSGRRFFRR